MPTLAVRPVLVGPAVALACVVLVACGGSGGRDDPVETTALPAGIAMHIDQSRVERKGREVFLRVQNDTTASITVSAFHLTSPRLADVDWSGDEEIGPTYETDLEFDLPRGRCGTSIDAKVVLTYRVGNGGLRRSIASADDPYGNAALFADRDCAQLTLAKAATLTVGDPSVSGAGHDSVLSFPVTLTPTDTATDVRFGGFGSTVLFRQTERSATGLDLAIPPGGPPVHLTMSVVPARCDPHALAEDKVGTLFGVTVLAPGLGPDSTYFLPLTKAQRSALFAFFSSHCGLP